MRPGGRVGSPGSGSLHPRPPNPRTETATVPTWLLPALAIGVPLIELYVLIQVGSEIGALPTIVICVLSAIIGIGLVRRQGLGILGRVLGAMAADELPALDLLDGALLLMAGFFLLLPGFITDGLGILLLVPSVRQWIIRRWVRLVPLRPAGCDPRPSSPRVIEGRFRRED